MTRTGTDIAASETGVRGSEAEEHRQKDRDSEEEEDSEEDWDDWEGEGDDMGSAQCLFCPECFPSLQAATAHCQEVHNFNPLQVKKELGLSFYGWIKLVNFIRRQTAGGAVTETAGLKARLDAREFEDDSYLTPVIESDVFLFGIEDEEDDEDDGTGVAEVDRATMGSTLTDKEENKQELDGGNELAKLHEMVNAYKGMLQRLTAKEPGPSLRRDNDTYYFASYSNLDIHSQMIRDKVRTEAYRDAILLNPNFFKGKTVLDIGCGTGILSLFAAQAGASLVIGIDCSDMADFAEKIVKENEKDGVVKILKGKVEELELPVDKVDIIISEWMGYALLYESMLDTVLYARDKWLAAEGLLLPNRTTIHIEGYEDPKNRVHFWDDVYGLKMTSLRPLLSLSEPTVEVLLPEGLLTDRKMVKDIDCMTVQIPELDFSEDFELTVSRDGRLDGFVISFDVDFDLHLEKPVHFSTSASSTPTHWQQTLLLLDEPLYVSPSTSAIIRGRLGIRKGVENPRELRLELDVEIGEDKIHQKYHMT